MRVFGRILYATIAVGFFLLAFTYSRDLMTNRYIEDVFGESLTDTNSDLPKYYYFYSSIPDFHNPEPVIEIYADGYEIMGYEVAKVSTNNDLELVVEEYIYFIIYTDTEDLSQIDYLLLENSSDETNYEIRTQRFKTLYLLNGVNDSGNVYISKDDVVNGNFDKLYFTNEEEDVLLETNFVINEDGFIIKDYMVDFYDQNSRTPDSQDLADLADNLIYPTQTHVTNDYVHIFYIGMGIYFAALIISLYFIYFRKRKKYN